MRIRFKQSIAGSNFAHKGGDIVDWPDAAEARRFIAADIAEEFNMVPRNADAAPKAPKEPKAPKTPKPTERADAAPKGRGKGKGSERATLDR